MEFGNIHKFAGSAVGFGKVVDNAAVEPDGVFDEESEILDGGVGAGTYVDEAGLVVMLHEEVAGVGEVIYMQEFATGSAGTPEDDFGCILLGSFYKFAEEGRQDVGILEVVVVVGAVEVGRHHTDEVVAVLVSIGVAEFDTGNFGDGIGLVGGFEGTGQEVVFAERLGCHFGVDAGGAEEHEFFHASEMGRVYGVGLDHEVVVEEFGAVGVVGLDASYFGSSQEDVIGRILLEKMVYGLLIAEVEFSRGFCNDVVVAFGF